MRSKLAVASLVILGVIMALQLTSDPKTNIDSIVKAAYSVNPNNSVLADLSACQAILESNLTGKPSQLASKYNNLFGIKGTGTGKIIDGKFKNRVNLPTSEYYPSRGTIKVDQFFAVNASLEDSFEQHKSLFERLSRYSKVLQATTIEDATVLVHKAGYATDPKYPAKLMQIYKTQVLPAKKRLKITSQPEIKSSSVSTLSVDSKPTAAAAPAVIASTQPSSFIGLLSSIIALLFKRG